jgi:hypothetical protein
MMRCYTYTNAKPNSPLQQKGNETMPTIKRTPLKANTLTITANKVNDAAASTAIALSIGKEKSEKKINKTSKEKEDKDASDYKERLELQRKITKINQLIPQVVDGYCNSRKIPMTIGARLRSKSRETTTGIFLQMH